jgi:Fe-S-cluster containining protein
MCCTYVATEIDAPETSDDFDMLRWYVSHEGCAVYLEKGKWYFETAARCKHLTKENLCAVYPSRPRICRDHGTDECEMAIEEYAWDVRLETLEDVEAYARIALRHKRTHGNGHFELSWERRARLYSSRSNSPGAKRPRRRQGA